MSDPAAPVWDTPEGLGENADGAADGRSERQQSVRVVDKRWWARDDTDSGAERGSDRPAYVEELERQLTEKDALLAEYARKYENAVRDFDQTRERLRRQLTRDVERETRAVLASFLEVVDNLDRALTAGERDGAGPDAAMLQGVALVRDQSLATLARYHVTRLDAAGQRFDPNQHDALSTVPVTDASQDGAVMSVVKPGYVIGDDVLRPASVTVGKIEP